MLFRSKDINNKLWDIENEKRLCEKNSDFGEVFIKTSRDIHFLNDKRGNIKLEINNYTGSKIKEIKGVTYGYVARAKNVWCMSLATRGLLFI